MQDALKKARPVGTMSILSGLSANGTVAVVVTSPYCHPGQAAQEYHHLREIGINICQIEVGRKENT